MKRAILLFTCLFYSCWLQAQKPKEILEWINSVTSVQQDFYDEIPFEYKNELIVIKVKIKDKVYDYIFDTGGYNTISDMIQTQNNYQVLTNLTVGSSNQLKKKVNLLRVDSLTIGQLGFTALGAIQMDLNSPTLKCTATGGLIGASIIKNYVWRLDYPNKKIIVTNNPDKISGLKNAIKLPVTFSKTLMPFVDVKINGKAHKFMIDLGSTGKFSMTEEAALKSAGNGTIYEKTGAETEGVNGATAQLVKTFQAADVELKGIKFVNQPVLFTKTETDNLIGNQLIKDYILTLNFKDSELYISPIRPDGLTTGWESFGMTLGYKDGAVVVKTLDKGLSAEKAGLQLNDKVVEIDNQKIAVQTECDFMTYFKELLSSKTSLDLTILRGDKTLQVTIAKEKVF